MNRAFALLAATACAALAVSSACSAAEWPSLPFRLAKTKDAGRVQFSIQHSGRSQRTGNWSQSVALAELQGLGAAPFTATGPTPVGFALVRPAGRFDCTGSVRSSDLRGKCTFAADATFSAMLERRGLGRPSPDQSFALTMSGFRPDVLDALAAAGYPRPTLDQSVALGIFKIGPAFVRGLSDAGYRLRSVDNLVAFKIHNVTPAYIASFAQVGYRDLPADKLLQLRIFGVTPDDVRALQANGVAAPSADQLVQRRIFGARPRIARRD